MLRCPGPGLRGGVRDVVFIVVRGTFGRAEWLSDMNACNFWARAADPAPEDGPAPPRRLFSRAA